MARSRSRSGDRRRGREWSPDRRDWSPDGYRPSRYDDRRDGGRQGRDDGDDRAWGPGSVPPSTGAAPHAPALVQQVDAQRMAQQMLARQMLGGGGAAAASLASVTGLAGVTGLGVGAGQPLSDRRAREIYFGNLAPGCLANGTFEEFFNSVFAHLSPSSEPAVLRVKPDPQGRFCFLEFRTDEMAVEALRMDRTVEFQGKTVHASRPKGYAEALGLDKILPSMPISGGAPAAPPGGGEGAGSAGVGAPSPAGTALAPAYDPTQPPSRANPTRFLLLRNLQPVSEVREEDDREALQAELEAEIPKFGELRRAAVPAPPRRAQAAGPARAYIELASEADARKVADAFDGRTLDGHATSVLFVTEAEARAAFDDGAWPDRTTTLAGLPLPGLYALAPLPATVTGLAAINPQLCAIAQTNPNLGQALLASIDPLEIPFEEGWVKARGLPIDATKAAVAAFLLRAAPEISPDRDVRLVYTQDGTPLGEAYVRIAGAGARLRFALAHDNNPLPGYKNAVEILTAVEEDLRRRELSGCRVE